MGSWWARQGKVLGMNRMAGRADADGRRQEGGETRPLHVQVLEPYYGGSHAAFVDALRQHSRHRLDVVTMPARKWKWRMRGAALWYVYERNEWILQSANDPIDLILCSDMLSVADLRATLPPMLRAVPIVCYFHENQLTYPLTDEQQRDYQYGMTNITSCLVSDAVWFNSVFHHDEFLAAAEQLLRKMPDCVPAGMVDAIRQKCEVLPPPVDAPNVPGRRNRFFSGPQRPDSPAPSFVPRILWCHRWEYDKNPEPFFRALIELDREGRAFELVVLGEQFRVAPAVFAKAWSSLSSHIIHAGFVDERSAYLQKLAECDIVVSTAIQENFGIAIVEAILAGCQPLLPNRLAYPELLPEKFHRQCLYGQGTGLVGHLRELLDGRGWLSDEERRELQNSTESRFSAPVAADRLDRAIEAAVLNKIPNVP